MTKKKLNSQNLKKNEFIKFLLIGLTLLLLSIIGHLTLDEHNFFAQFLIQLFSHFGLGFLVIAVLTIILETNHWRKYFEERLSDLVIDKVYLRNIDREKLINLQTDVLKVYFQNDDLGGEDGFLNHYQKNIQSIIGLPYRKNVNLSLEIGHNADDQIELTEIMTFTCMNNGEKLQENVSFVPEIGELIEIKDIEITVQTEKDNKPITKIFDYNQLKELNCITDNELGFVFPLKEYNKNKLRVKYKVKSILTKSRFIAWRMSHPTKGLTINIHFPKGLKFAKELFINENITFIEDINEKEGYFSISISDWLLPDEGFVFQVLK